MLIWIKIFQTRQMFIFIKSFVILVFVFLHWRYGVFGDQSNKLVTWFSYLVRAILKMDHFLAATRESICRVASFTCRLGCISPRLLVMDNLSGRSLITFRCRIWILFGWLSCCWCKIRHICQIVDHLVRVHFTLILLFYLLVEDIFVNLFTLRVWKTTCVRHYTAFFLTLA